MYSDDDAAHQVKDDIHSNNKTKQQPFLSLDIGNRKLVQKTRRYDLDTLDLHTIRFTLLSHTVYSTRVEVGIRVQ